MFENWQKLVSTEKISIPFLRKSILHRINLNYTFISKINCDIKDIYTVNAWHRITLVGEDEVTNYLVMITLYRGTSHKIGESFINCIFFKQCSPSYLMFYED